MRSDNFERIVSEVAAGIWNQLIEKPAFSRLRINDYMHVLDAVSEVLTKHYVPETMAAKLN